MLRMNWFLLIIWTSGAYAQLDASLTRERLLALNKDWEQLHEARPMGVPRDYSWSIKPRLGAGNLPGTYLAAVPWGHVFWARDTIGHPGLLQMRNFNAYVCSGEERTWKPMRAGKLDGAQFRADFKGNSSKSPPRFDADGGIVSVLFDAGHAFHFWPSNRTSLPKAEICGFVVLLQARVIAADSILEANAGGLLVGLGADYWAGMSGGWDNFKTNTDIAIGRLKYVGREWAWYGLSTATDADLSRLYDSGLIPLAGS